MALGISSFVMDTSRGYSNGLTYGKLLLTNFANALVTASNNYSIESAVEIMGSRMSESTSYCRHTILLKNNYTGEYLRIWCFNGSNPNIISSTGDNTSSSDCKIYKGNYLCQGINSNYYYTASSLYFGVKDAFIDTDPAHDLGLKIPIFSLAGGLYTNSSIKVIDLVTSSYKSKYCITSDGSGFTFIYHSYNSTPNSSVCLIYHPQAISTQSGDTHTDGCLLLSRDNENPYMDYEISRMRGIWTSAGGSFSYGQWLDSLDPLNATAVTPMGDKVSCIPSILFSLAPNYAQSTSYLNAEGTASAGSFPDNSIGFKGYTNQNLIRRCSADRVSTIGAVYGGWLCIGKGWLIPWASGHDSDSPYVET